MQRRAFLRNLAKLKGQFQISPFGKIRTRTTASYTWCNDPKKYTRVTCPIEALTIKDGKIRTLDECIEKLGLDHDLSSLIIGAADYENKPNTKQQRLRKQIIKVLGLDQK